LYHRGAFYAPSSNAQTPNSKDLNPIAYYVGDVNGERNGSCIGLIDFVVYDILLLLVLSPSSSITTNILLTLGCIVSVQGGHVGTIMIFGRLCRSYIMPAVPLLVINFSIYLLILSIVTTSSDQCIEYSIPAT